MIKVSVLYPNTEGSRFDMDYYVNKHMPMVQSKLGSSCLGVKRHEDSPFCDTRIPHPSACPQPHLLCFA